VGNFGDAEDAYREASRYGWEPPMLVLCASRDGKRVAKHIVSRAASKAHGLDLRVAEAVG